MKLKTRLIIAFFVILFVPFLMFAVAFFGFSKYQMRMIEQSYGVPMSLESLSDSMQVIGKLTESGRYMLVNDMRLPLAQPKSDALYEAKL